MSRGARSSGRALAGIVPRARYYFAGERLPRSVRWCMLIVLIASPLVAGPVNHVRFLPDPAEDMRLGATTPSGKLPAAMNTRSGMVSAPTEAQRRTGSMDQAYGGTRTPTSADASYHVDRLTTRPERVQYDEPFRPSILPFKRLYAFDVLQDDLSFAVSSQRLTNVIVGGDAEMSEDTFFGDIDVDLVKGVPVRIPSVGPGARLLAMHVDPPRSVEILEDSAENWFARSAQGGRVRIVMQLAINRQGLGSQFLPVAWPSLIPHVTPLPEKVSVVAAEVAQHIGVRREDSPARAVITLVQYFRKFRESSELPRATRALELYRELSFEQKGVCRHRAYAFAITAIALGIPTRLVHNEAHAWVEVFDTQLWHRIDLGGAASQIQELRPDPNTPHHKPPSDPYSWPAGFSSARPEPKPLSPPRGAQADTKGDRSQATGIPPSLAPPGKSPGTISSSSQATVAPSAASASTKVSQSVVSGQEKRVAPEVKLFIDKKRLLRGAPLPVSGSAEREGRHCAFSRIDIFIDIPRSSDSADGSNQKSVSIGSLATDQDGKFKGQVTLPRSTPVGPLNVSAKVAGGCGERP